MEEGSVIRNFRITAKDGKSYNTKHYNLSSIIAVGYKVNSERAVQFRKWATGIIKEYTIKAYVMDKVSAEIAKAHAESEFEKYRIVQDRLFESDFDKQVKVIEKQHKKQIRSGGEDEELDKR